MHIDITIKGQQNKELSALVTPLYNVWQYGCVSRHSLPLYAEEDEYIIGKVEAVSVTSITSLVGAPPSHVLQLRSDTNTFHKLNQQVCSHNHHNNYVLG